jgi:4-diphosphocytidyl-2-C-methyl-D-erythritol kinase
VPVATKHVFTALGLKPGDVFALDQRVAPVTWPGKTSADWITAIRSGRNDLEPPALRIQPVIDDVLTALRESNGCQLARMSGSGATCFGLFSSEAAAQAAEQRISARESRWWVVATTLS